MMPKPYRAIIEFCVIAIIVISLIVYIDPTECPARYKMMIRHKNGQISVIVFTAIPYEMQKKYADGEYVDMHLVISADSTVENVKVIRFCDRKGEYKPVK